MSDKAKPVELPEPTLLRTVVPDDWRYGHVYGYTAGQLREAIAAERKRHMAEVEALRAELEVAESALLRKGYRKTCDIAACNCGSQWNHGGHAEQRLSEIGEALRGAGFNGGTLLGNIETVCAERDALRADAERYRWLRSQHEVDDERASDNNYGKSYPPRTMTVFVDDGHDGLDPLPCDPGALDAAIDAAKEQR